MFPRRPPPTACSSSATTPENAGAAADVPPIASTESLVPLIEQSCPLTSQTIRSGLLPLAALTTTSGVMRMVAGFADVGSVPTRVHCGSKLWYEGRAQTWLMPPPPAPTLGGSLPSFQHSSWVLYPWAAPVAP